MTQKEINEKLLESIEKLSMAIIELKDKSSIAKVEQKMSDFKMDYTPAPISRAPITTQNEALEEIMLRSGMLSREAWEKLRGVTYDDYGEASDDDMLLTDSFDDEEFSQSQYSSYYEPNAKKAEVSASKSRLEVPNVETKEVDIASAPNTPEASPPKPAQEASEQGGEK